MSSAQVRRETASPARGTSKRTPLVALGLLVASLSARAGASEPAIEVPVWLSGTLGEDVGRVRSVWQKSSRVQMAAPRFLERGEQIPIVLPAPEGDNGSCITVLALGERSLSFVLSFERTAPLNADDRGDAGGAPLAGEFPIPSTAGLAEVTRCGPRRHGLQRLKLSLRSPRGTVQLLIARGAAPPPSAAEVLVSRTPGPLAPLQAIGSRPALGPLPHRLDARRRAHLARGAQSVAVFDITPDARGDAHRLVSLRPGCHRLDVLTGEVGGSTPDVDARLIDPTSGVTLGDDEATASDAALLHCVAEETAVRLEVRGAQGPAQLAGLLATWRIPKGLPATWGRLARVAVARTLFDQELGMLGISQQPEKAALGVVGGARLFLPTEPGACYRLVAAAFRGRLTRLALGLRQGALLRQAQSDEAPGAELTFCAERRGPAQVEVQADGDDLVWLFAAWRLPTDARPVEETP